MVKTVFALLISAFRHIMDPRVSPLRHLPSAQRFQVTCVLGTMWTTAFCLGTSAWLYYGELVIFHVLLASGTLATGLTFRSASRHSKTYRDFPAADGTARYPDVWGG